ncbi:MAG: type II toxin-antitoxin system RatA family toxin [Cytophagales bacterium]|nr:type II toxin-antitoxin system RatA family toxin [Rhizobacter sp.]
MKHVKKSVLLSYSAPEMYTLVIGVPEYPKFLPWCEKAEVLSSEASGMTAKLHLVYGGLRHAFTTRNTHVADRSVLVSLVDGPFSVLDGSWRFLPLALAGDAAACKIEFEMRYAFANRPLEVMVSPVFDRVANTFVDAFVKRAEQVYGER